MDALVRQCRLKPVEPRLKSAWFKRLKLKCERMVSSFAFNFNLRRYTLGSVHRVRKEHGQAVEWYMKGAEAGLPISMFKLAEGLDTGEMVAVPDYPAAVYWYRRAAAAGLA